MEVLHNNWMDEATQRGEISADEDPKMRELKLKMISRQEDVQVKALLIIIITHCLPNVKVGALKDYYEGLAEVNANESLLATCDYIGHNVIPTFAIMFIVFYWIMGLLKYNYPEWGFVEDLHNLDILPTFEVKLSLSTFQDKVYIKGQRYPD